MKIRTLVVGYVLALALFLFAQRHPENANPSGFHGVVDLTHSFSSDTTANRATVVPASDTRSDRNPGFANFGTRIDAPAQFSRGLWTVDQIPAERLIAPLVILDVRANTGASSDYKISVEDVARWERANGQIPLGSVVMARTGWDSHWNSPRDYRNADSKGVMHFPGYSEDAAKFLVEGRQVVGLGIDTLSVDAGPSHDLAVQNYTLAHSVYHLENVANLDRVPASGAIAVVAPAKVAGSSGGPVRVMALVR